RLAGGLATRLALHPGAVAHVESRYNVRILHAHGRGSRGRRVAHVCSLASLAHEKFFAMNIEYEQAIAAVSELLTKLRLDFMFVGSVARASWLGGTVDSGSIDVVAVMQPQQKNQIAMMASNRGFTVDRDEVEKAEELDLVPLKFG